MTSFSGKLPKQMPTPMKSSSTFGKARNFFVAVTHQKRASKTPDKSPIMQQKKTAKGEGDKQRENDQSAAKETGQEGAHVSPPQEPHGSHTCTVERGNVQVLELPIQPSNTSHELRATSSSGDRSRGISERAAMSDQSSTSTERLPKTMYTGVDFNGGHS